MKIPRISSSLALVAIVSATAHAQHAQVSAVAVDPTQSNMVWVCNRDNDSVSRIDVSTGNVIEIPVGVKPRSLAFSHDGALVFVANQRGNIPTGANIVLGFPANPEPGTVSVIDVAGLAVQSTITDVGVEAYGVAVAPSGLWFAVSGFRSGTIKFYDVATQTLQATHQFERNLNFLSSGTIADHDSNRDGVADLGDPRGFTIDQSSTRMYVTHNKSSYISVLDVSLATGLPTGAVLVTKINVDEYPFDTFFNTTKVTTVESQGKPRFLEDIAVSPDGTRALVPHLLHNVNHDVGHDFGGAIAGDFANRVYPALTVIDLANGSYGNPGDNSNRLHHQLSDDPDPALYTPYGNPGTTSFGDKIILGGVGAPVLGAGQTIVVSGLQPGDTAILYLGTAEASLPFLGGILLLQPRRALNITTGHATLGIPDFALYHDLTAHAQVLVNVGGLDAEFVLSNGLHLHLDQAGPGLNKMGHRAGHPSKVLYNAAGDNVVMLNRGSEDLFLYSVNGSDMTLRSVFPPRLDHVERTALDTTTAMGDMPLGMAMVADLTTVNDDSLLYIVNEATHSLTSLRVDWTGGTIHEERGQINTLTGPDNFSVSERIGQELFEDASRAQTAGNFNNSCASCHFEGGADANVWQRGAGPRSTMPVYGGTLGTGLILWKGVRLNLGETGPMFGGENGGTGILTDAEQQGLVDYHETIPFPLNPNLEAGMVLSAQAAMGRDLFFGTNDCGLNCNPTLRHAGCAACHAEVELNPALHPGPRFYTLDFVDPMLTGGENLQAFDPDCFSLRENIVAINIRNVNTIAVTAATDPIPDRNLDGYIDYETYGIMNEDTDDDFKRDDNNSYLCDCTVGVPNCDSDGHRIFRRPGNLFVIPTKAGVFATAPYFHDHAAYSLRSLVHPDSQTVDVNFGFDAIYGSAAWGGQPPYPGLNKIFNEEHDIFGHEDITGISDVQINLQSGSLNQKLIDMEAILSFIQSL
ncbi:MAG: hypothetical protein E2O39_02650 [Planctomycetota bacterium]|nr:MAG: hypothetical protein E2O39_02650 [Planctomycetota bacterium]